jgi:hypothetical protein
MDGAQGMRIYQLMHDTTPDNTLEIGLGYSFSTVYFLAVIRANGKGHHVAVDPYQMNPWNGVGLTREKVLGIELQGKKTELACRRKEYPAWLPSACGPLRRDRRS